MNNIYIQQILTPNMFLALVGTYYSSVVGLDCKITYRLTYLALNLFL